VKWKYYNNYVCRNGHLQAKISGAMNIQELGEQYRKKTEEELLRLALARDELTLEANLTLTGELTRRGIASESRLDAARKDEQERKAENERSLGTLGVFHLFGVGRIRLGSADRTYNPETGLERFRTTVFIVLFCFPLIPTGTYLVQRTRAYFPDQLTVLEKLPLDWEQVLRIWVAAASAILGFVWIIKIVSSNAVWRLVHHFWR
jgi:hypothetical protein